MKAYWPKLKIVMCIVAPILVLLLPADWIPLNSVTVIEQRVMAIFVMALLMWVFEPIPIFATSVLVIVLELLLISTKGIKALRPENAELLLDYKAIMGTFSSPIIMLFLGGFFLAMAAKKYRLDQNLARVMLKPFGKRPGIVLIGLMLITAVFSMFMSNTATTAMMLAILMPVLDAFEDDDPGRIAFVLSIPFAANIGGLGTPIGTPPNAVAMKYLVDDNAISFGKWMAFSVPFVIVMLAVCWVLLLKFHKPRASEITLSIKDKFLKSPKAIIVYITFGLTILLWLTGDFTGMNSYVVAMIPVGVFCAFGIITSEDLKKMSWDVLWLVSGGIALGIGLEKSGLSKNLVTSIAFDKMPVLMVIIACVMIALLMATFMSNTATANLVLPVIAALGVTLTSLDAWGGSKMLILATTYACSMAMALPVSTPPNAMAYATGMISSRNMCKLGVMLDAVGLVGIALLIYILNQVGFL